MLELVLWAVVVALMFYALIRGKWSWFEVLVPAFFLLGIGVLIGLNTPNPDWVYTIQVAVP